MAGRDLSDPMFWPVFARIEALELLIFPYPGNALGAAELKPRFLALVSTIESWGAVPRTDAVDRFT
jgi:hypothetical protein